MESKRLNICFQEFSILPNVQNQKIHFIGSRRTKFGIFEFSDHSTFSDNMFKHKGAKKSDPQTPMTQSDTCISADAFLLCFSISSRSSLFNAMKYWVPTLTTTSPSTPIVLVGCKSDMRTVHRPVYHLNRHWQSPRNVEH